MSVVVAEGVVVVTADGKKIPGQIRGDIEGNQGPIEGAGRRTGSNFLAAFGGSFLGVGLANIATSIVSTIGNAIGTGLRSAIDFAIGGIDIASGLAEADSAINQVFGDGAASVRAFAEGAAGSIGQSELAAMKAAQNLGVYGSAAGLAGEANAEFATGLVALGSDFASFFDTSPEQAIEAIGAGLRGESEPLRQYGVLLDDATLKARAMSMGIFDGNGSLTQQQRVLAAQAEIMAQAGAATGDFERTSGGLANQQRTLAAELENAQGKLGEALLPALLTLTTFANDELVPILNDVIEVIGPMLGDALSESAPLFVEMLQEIAPHIPELIRLGVEALPKIIEGLIQITPPLIDFAGKLILGAQQIGDFFGGMFSFLGQAAEQWGWFVGGVVQWLQGAIGSIQGFFMGVMNWINQAIGTIGRFGRAVGDGVGEAVGFVASLPGKVGQAIAGVGTWLYDSGKSLIQGFINGIKGMIGSVGDAVGGVMDFVGGFFPNSPAKRGPFSGAGWNRIGAAGGAIIDQFESGLQARRPAVAFPNLGGILATQPGIGSTATVGVSPSASGSARGETHFHLTQQIQSTDPILAARQAAREAARYLGV